MEQKLQTLFDYQKFQQNRKLQTFIDETRERYGRELLDEELDMLNAAGGILHKKKADTEEK